MPPTQDQLAVPTKPTNGAPPPAIPQVGMMATVRNRRAMVAGVDPYDGHEGRLHLVRLEYTDSDGPPQDAVIWEREPATSLLQPKALPNAADSQPMPGADFDALVRAARWSALTPYVDPDDDGPLEAMPVAAPLYGAVQAEDFQLVPLLIALRAPRVSLLLADDVGLGKTVEAGLILTELLRRRRIRRVLILCPAALRTQWRSEMADKFSLLFDEVDRDGTHALQKRMGLDLNPWRTFPRIIASYYYLRQPDVLEQFAAACRQPPGAHTLPWDLLIVDEAHNLMPAGYGEDSDLVEMLRTISPWFEHKLFLTATPHNGHTRSFTGLLELLDPVRFNQTTTLSPAMRERVDQAVVRRLKRDVNALDDRLDRPRRFPERHVKPLPLYFDKREQALMNAFHTFRLAIRKTLGEQPPSEQAAGHFSINVLGKRLLSCPTTFAESWERFARGIRAGETVSTRDVEAARRATEAEMDDDLEREGRAAHAATTVGAWLRPLADSVADEIAAVDAALRALGLEMSPGDAPDAGAARLGLPRADARFERLAQLVDELLRLDRKWKSDERLIVFTEYKTSLDYIANRLREAYDPDGEGVVRLLFGGMDSRERDAISDAFNDPDAPVRILVGTDAASEGLNLQASARYILHWEIPWNPARLEQRNGRLDRHGQARDVTVHHFTSEQSADLEFLDYVVHKVHSIREDLGAVGEIFDAAFQRRFIDLEATETVRQAVEADVAREQQRTAWLQQGVGTDGLSEKKRLQALMEHIDLSPETLRATLERALGIGVGYPRLEGPDARGRFRLASPIPPAWAPLIDDTLRRETASAALGALPGLIFDPEDFVTTSGDRPVFRPRPDTVLLHLGHPLLGRALTQLNRARFPGSDALGVSRWTVRHGAVPEGADALVLLTVKELAANELREPFHHWLRTLRLPLAGGEVGDPLPYVAAAEDRPRDLAPGDEAIARAQRLWDDASFHVRPKLEAHAAGLAHRLRQALERRGAQSLAAAKARFKDRIAEVRMAKRDSTLAKLEQERAELREALSQRSYLSDVEREREAKLRDLEEELRRRRAHFDDLVAQLERERDRVVDGLLPQRHRLRGEVQVLPVALEIRLPAPGPGPGPAPGRVSVPVPAHGPGPAGRVR